MCLTQAPSRGRQRAMVEGPAQRNYHPGELAPTSGIYRVIHADAHREPHNALIIKGEDLPPCRSCGSEVVFQVVQALSHVTHEWDFAGPQALAAAQIKGTPELRQTPRYEIELPMEIRSSQAAETERRTNAVTCNISQGGVNATFDGRIRAGEPVELAIYFPRSARPFRALARVRHVKGRRHGFEFLRLTSRRREKLADALAEV